MSDADDSIDATGEVTDSVAFSDDFERSPGESLRNGWVERNPSALVLRDGEVYNGEGPSLSYVDNLAHRPLAEAFADGEVSVDVRVYDYTNGTPQVHARSHVNASDGRISSYVCFLAAEDIVLRRLNDSSATDLDTRAISGLQQGEIVRLFVTTEGTGAVTIECGVDRNNGSSPTVIVAVDDSASRIAEAGPAGLSQHTNGGGFTYDNFVAVESRVER